MKPSEQIYRLQSHLDRSLHRVQLWIVGDLQEIGVQVAALETANADLLEALKAILLQLGNIDTTKGMHQAIRTSIEAIRKHKGE